MASIALCILPPAAPGDVWFGYAKNEDHSFVLDGGDDPTPDMTKAHGKTAGACAMAVWALVKKMEG